MYGAGDVRVIDAPDPTIQQPTDALVRVTRACVCGSDLHPFHSAPASEHGASDRARAHRRRRGGRRRGDHRRAGDFVIAPFAISCGACEFCRAGLQTSCVNGGFWNDAGLGVGGGQAEAVRVPLADGTLVAVPGVDDATDERAAGLPAHPLRRLRHRLARRRPGRRDRRAAP